MFIRYTCIYKFLYIPHKQPKYEFDVGTYVIKINNYFGKNTDSETRERKLG